MQHSRSPRTERALDLGSRTVARHATAAALAFLLTAPAALVQDEWSQEFDRPGLPLGESWAVEQYQGELFAGGIGFFEADGHTFGAVARFDGTLRRFFVNQADVGGTTLYTGIVSYANANFPPAFQITAGSTWHFQDWYRDPAGPCGLQSNVTNALSVTFQP